ncbi:MAG: AI-2E family transporter [Acetobacteraceae bacterium]
MLPTWEDKRRAVQIAIEIERNVAGYLATITVMNALVGLFAGSAMWLLGLPDPLLWGTFAFLLNYVPIIGPITGIACFFFVGLFIYNNPLQAFVPAGIYLVIHILEGETITPILLARRLTLNPGAGHRLAAVLGTGCGAFRGRCYRCRCWRCSRIICDRHARPGGARPHAGRRKIGRTSRLTFRSHDELLADSRPGRRPPGNAGVRRHALTLCGRFGGFGNAGQRTGPRADPALLPSGCRKARSISAWPTPSPARRACRPTSPAR